MSKEQDHVFTTVYTVGKIKHTIEEHFTYVPGEKEVRYYADGSGDPGTAATIILEEILLDGTSILDALYELGISTEQREQHLFEVADAAQPNE